MPETGIDAAKRHLKDALETLAKSDRLTHGDAAKVNEAIRNAKHALQDRNDPGTRLAGSMMDFRPLLGEDSSEYMSGSREGLKETVENWIEALSE